MENNIEFLNYIYENAEMGVVGITDILPEIKNKDFLKTIKEQERDYRKIAEEAQNLLSTYSQGEPEVPTIAKVMTYIDAKRKTFLDKTTTNMAKMMMDGNNKGIIEIEEKLNSYPHADKKIINLAKKLLYTEKRNIENLKKYL